MATGSDLWLLFQCLVWAMRYGQAQECGMLLGEPEGSMILNSEMLSLPVMPAQVLCEPIIPPVIGISEVCIANP